MTEYLNSSVVYTLPSFEEVMVSRQRVQQDSLCSMSLTEGIGVFNDGTILKMSMENDEWEKLYKKGTQSLVGKGTETVLDKTIRSSKEFVDIREQSSLRADRVSVIKWDDAFVTEVKQKVEEMLGKMNAGKLVSIKPHKLLIYGKGDFFSEHIDSLHTKGQTMSCVVNLDSSWEGSDYGLIVDGTGYIPRDTEDDNYIVVFDHDLKHSVPKVKKGFRVSVTFDLVVETNEEKKDLKKMLKKDISLLKSKGVKRFGFFASHTYFRKQQLKGTDKILVGLLESLKLDVKEECLKTDDRCWWYLERVWEYKNSGPECGHLLHEVEPEEDEEDEEDNYRNKKSRSKVCSI